MVGLTHAARIATHDDQFFPPETDVVLTSTIRDADLAGYTFEDELRLIRSLKPQFVLPFDFPVYSDMPPDRRQSHCEQVAAGAIDMATVLGPTSNADVDHFCQVKDLPRDLVEPVQSTTVIPLVKGTTPAERSLALDAARTLDAPVIAKYGVQYMTVSGNGSYPQLVADLETLSDESNEYPTLVIGLASPSGRYSLDGVPDNVVSAAGTNQWVKRVDPLHTTPAEQRTEFAAYYNATADTLALDRRYHAAIAAATRDDPPTPLTKQPGHAVGNDLSPSLSGASADGGYGFGERKRPDTAADAATAGRLGGQQPSRRGGGGDRHG
jgi:hypothetical protein